jgi:hypothetical protein
MITVPNIVLGDGLAGIQVPMRTRMQVGLGRRIARHLRGLTALSIHRILAME